MKRKSLLWLSLSLIVLLEQTALPAGFVSHPPMRPLPEASKRPMDKGTSFFVDAKKGDDQSDGSKDKPWKTIQHAVEKATTGSTLYLRAGVFYEHVSVTKSGEAGKPITIRSYPGELAILDGGVREFFENPETSWEPAKDGASNEYVSKQAFQRSGKEKVSGQFVNDDDEPFTGVEDDRPLALGNFGDSMVTLHGYRFLRDLRASEDGIWRLKGKDDSEVGLYVGPGLWFDRKEGRVHIRLSPTKFDWLGEGGNYRGETDPRKIPLVIAVGRESNVLDIKNASHIRVQDIVLRGAAGRALIDIEESEDVELDGLTVFGGSPSLLGNSTKNLRVLNCAFRSLGSAPWESRASMKYRGTPSYVIIAREGKPQNQDWEIAHCEFTDGHDFAYFRWIQKLRFHHNFVENFNDDGLEFGPRTRDQLAWVYCNLITQTEIVLSQHEVDREPPDQLKVNPGTGTYVFRNIIDLRKPTYCQPKRTDDEALRAKGKSPSVWRVSGLCGDHGSPIWAQYYFYQNTVLKTDPAWRDHYAFGLGEEGLFGKSYIAAKAADAKSPRRVFNNIFVQLEGLPGLVLAAKPDDVDLQVDGNLLWAFEQGPTFKGDFFAKLRSSPSFAASKKQYPPGWGATDRFADPKFNRFPGKNGSHEDLSLQKDSPALKAGVAIPAEWPDPLRAKKAGSPDVGAVPSGVPLWKVGVNDRLEVLSFPQLIMISRISKLQLVLMFLTFALALSVAVGATTCPPMRPLAEPSQRPIPSGPTFFVDALKGDDRNDGSKEKPWKTVGYATAKLKPGDTLCLRGGIFHERVRVSLSGEKGHPITIRGYPGELTILDGGIPEFLENPGTAWEPVKDGAKDEYVSKRVFSEWKMPKLVGSFAESMVPLIGYGFPSDLSAGEDGVWKLKDKADPEPGVYCGPGISFNEADHHIHVRLARTRFDWLDEAQNYRGETDPRKVPLIVAGNVTEAVLTVKNGHHLRFQDLVLRGSGRQPLIDLDADEDIEFDGLTCHGGYPGLRAHSTKGLRIVNSAFRGLAAPWSSRALMKYRSKPTYILISSPGQPLNADWEIVQCEFTDGHDFAHLREIHNLRFHHNFVDNFNDDGLEMGPRTKDQLAWIYCNQISRCLSFITQHETITMVEVDPGTGIYIFRNIIDMRQPTYGSPRRADMVAGGADEDREMWRTCELGTDHKSPIWCNYYFYQNTVLKKEPAWRDQYAFGFAVRGLTGPPRPWNGEKTIRSPRRVFNNIFFQVEGLPGLVLPPKPEEVDMQTDGNLFWGVEQGTTFKGDFFAKVRQSKAFEESKKQYPAGWTAHDVFGDPKFAQWTNEKGKSPDLSLLKTSPAVNAGVKIPSDWLDPLRDQDKDAPDIGALPLGVAPWKVGVNGRIPVLP